MIVEVSGVFLLIKSEIFAIKKKRRKKFLKMQDRR